MEFLDDLLKLKYDFRISGEIVDPDGNLVPGVMVLSSKSKGPMSESFDRKKLLISNGRFSFDSKGVFSWGLTCEKYKYYSVTVGMGITSILDGVTNGDESLSISNDTITQKKKIILYPYGKLNHDLLTVDNKILAYSESGDNKKIECLVIPYEDKGKRRRKVEEFRFIFTEEKKLPDNLIYIVPGYKQDGAHDGTIRLKTSGKNSGFLPVKYDGLHCFRSMWEAPEKGDYQPELIIEDGLPNYLQHNYVKPKSFGNLHSIGVSKLVPKTVPYIVFYFKVGGYYGKGLIKLDNPQSKLDKSNASLRIYLYVNRYPGIRDTNIWLGTDW